jgi:hypothetical protein
MRDETNIDFRKALATSGAALSLALPRRNLLPGSELPQLAVWR